jgi:cell division protein FtsW (lipid II flippase)
LYWGGMHEIGTSDTGQVRRHRPDYWLIAIAVILVAIGLTVVYAISPALSATDGGSGAHYVSRQLMAVGLSIVAFWVTGCTGYAHSTGHASYPGISGPSLDTPRRVIFAVCRALEVRPYYLVC